MDSYPMKVIARVRSDLGQKFGIPRQSGLVPELRATIEFEPEFRNSDALRGLADFSHLWLIWVFSDAVTDHPKPTVRPPRLEGERLGVFATRSPHRPNPIGLSSVAIESVEGASVVVSGADLMDGTPILDIKPYIATDSHPDASVGFTTRHTDYRLDVSIPEDLLARVPASKQSGLRGVLADDPRPHFHHDPEREYGLNFAGLNVRFVVSGQTLTVVGVEKLG